MARRASAPVHVGHQLWHALTLNTILAEAGPSARARVLTEIMTLNRLVALGHDDLIALYRTPTSR